MKGLQLIVLLVFLWSYLHRLPHEPLCLPASVQPFSLSSPIGMFIDVAMGAYVEIDSSCAWGGDVTFFNYGHRIIFFPFCMYISPFCGLITWLPFISYRVLLKSSISSGVISVMPVAPPMSILKLEFCAALLLK